ncbi:hypothetical protein P7K49_014713 [Saguinus oedipus]|uniref:Uncharacterized protein n=1 Tax=Saguinus oedipus TaxID=9490 RepID=A0ABQ9V755_SAGOE|nr:hypothetical protein P7K49_014713 [Saguinus oedipus]
MKKSTKSHAAFPTCACAGEEHAGFGSLNTRCERKVAAVERRACAAAPPAEGLRGERRRVDHSENPHHRRERAGGRAGRDEGAGWALAGSARALLGLWAVLSCGVRAPRPTRACLFSASLSLLWRRENTIPRAADRPTGLLRGAQGVPLGVQDACHPETRDT